MHYFRTLVVARKIDVTAYQFSAVASTAYSDTAGLGFPIAGASELGFRECSEPYAVKLSEARLRRFFANSERDLSQNVSEDTDD